MNRSTISDSSIERMVSALLRVGVLISGAIVLGGGILYLFRHSHDAVHYGIFQTQSLTDRRIGQILKNAMLFRSRSIIQAGILCLIATPIARVALSLVGFALERDRTYCWITAIVLIVLLYSIINGAIQG